MVVAVITFAHRGARLVEPENTIAAFRRALEEGASGIETDVWVSADGEVVCVHDPVVTRGLRRRRIASVRGQASAPLTTYERNVYAVRLPDGRLQLVSQ